MDNKDAYYIAEWDEDSEWSEDYSMLKGPNGFECCLTEPEDRMWYRDGGPVIRELNRLHDENAKLYREGYKAGLTAYAWWKDGVQYVGSCGTTLKDAMKELPDA